MMLRRGALIGLLAVAALPSAAWAAGGGHGGVDWLMSVILPFANMALFLTIIILVVRKPAGAFFQKRAQSLAEALDSAERAQREAEGKIAEFGRRIAELETERAAILKQSRAEAETEAHRIVNEAKQRADATLKALDQTIEAEVRKAKQDLRQETIARLVADVAAVFERAITAEDRARLAEQAIRSFDPTDLRDSSAGGEA